MKALVRMLLLLMIILGLLGGGLRSSAGVARGASSVLQVVDVAPDSPFGTPDKTGFDPAGRMMTVVVDPQQPSVLYAASQYAGVWKSTDGAHTWTWASTGLTNGQTPTWLAEALAIDANDPLRLIYATVDDDARVQPTGAGLWISRDGAGHWSHVALPNCATPGVNGVAFSVSHALAATRCGVAVSNSDLTAWRLSLPPGATSIDHIAAGGSSTIYACSGTRLWQSTLLGLPDTWVAESPLPGSCADLAVVPHVPNAVLVLWTAVNPPSKADVVLRTLAHHSETSVDLRLNYTGDQCCGALSVTAVPRQAPAGHVGPGQEYDVFASVGYHFYELTAPGSWQTINGVHVDTFSLAVPPSYNPAGGECTAYLTNDGGVFANTYRRPGHPCRTASGPWVRAESGLHTVAGFDLAGLSQGLCGTPPHPCTALYLPSSDNGTWGTQVGGVPGTSWQSLECCGDTGGAYMDPALPGQMLTTRNGDYELFRSGTGRPPTKGDDRGNIAPHDSYDGIAPPQTAAVAQVLTMPGAVVAAGGDYLALESPNRVEKTAVNRPDLIVRRFRGLGAHAPCTPHGGGGWVDVSPHAHFSAGRVGAIAASGGHCALTIYVLTANTIRQTQNGNDTTIPISGGGRVYRGQVNDVGQVAAWTAAFKGLIQAYNLFVDPYDPRVLYASDVGAQAVMASPDGGLTWTPQTALTALATANGTYLFDCGAPAKLPDSYGFHQECPLAQMLFVRDHPEIRVAVLYPGGVAFSRDAGADWIPLVGATAPIDRPFSAFYDAARRSQPSLYIALYGRSIIRVDAPFRTLAAITFHLSPLPVVGNVAAVDDSTGTTTPLVRGADGSFSGVELLDTATLTSLQYHYVYTLRLPGSGLTQHRSSERTAQLDLARRTGVLVLADSLAVR